MLHVCAAKPHAVYMFKTLFILIHSNIEELRLFEQSHNSVNPYLIQLLRLLVESRKNRGRNT